MDRFAFPCNQRVLYVPFMWVLLRVISSFHGIFLTSMQYSYLFHSAEAVIYWANFRFAQSSWEKADWKKICVMKRFLNSSSFCDFLSTNILRKPYFHPWCFFRVNKSEEETLQRRKIGIQSKCSWNVARKKWLENHLYDFKVRLASCKDGATRSVLFFFVSTVKFCPRSVLLSSRGDWLSVLLKYF